MFRSLELTASGLFSDELMFVVHSLRSDYRAPAILDDSLVVSTRVLQCGRAFVLLAQPIYRSAPTTAEKTADSGELLCRGEVKIACVKRDNVRPRRLPQDIYRALSEVSSQNCV
jgi:YbgC/YbaW family acyl-CoA thioester hydrolase